MRSIIVLFYVFVCFQAQAQFYGLARRNMPSNEVYLATANPTTGLITTLNSSSLSPMVNLTGAALDPYRQLYHFVGAGGILSVDLNTGTLVRAAALSNPIANSYFDNYRFNNSDSTLYGLARRVVFDPVTQTYNGEVYLATVDPVSGVITQISPTSLGQGFALAGSAIDPYQKVFYYSTGSVLMGIDMYTGLVYSNPTIKNPTGIMFDNFAYSCTDSSIYGLIRQNYFDTIYDPISQTYQTILDSTSIHLGKINPATGHVTVVSPTSIAQGGYSLNSGATIDPNTNTYFYNNGVSLVGVNINTGLITSQPPLSFTNGQFFELMRISENCIQVTQPNRPNPRLTSTNTTVYETEMQLYPNPVNDLLHLKLNSSFTQLDIVDAAGRTIMQLNATPNNSINLSSLAPGVYWVKATNNHKHIIKKIIKS